MHLMRRPVEPDLITPMLLDAAGRFDDEELKRAILATRFFAQAPHHPGFLASSTPDGPVIPVFTSLARLARHAGDVRWFATTGLDLMSLAPVGHRFVIDPGAPHEIVIDPDVFAPPSEPDEVEPEFERTTEADRLG